MGENYPDSNDLIPKDTRADKALDIGAFVAAVIPIPWLAPAISFVLGGISNQRKIRRIHEVLEQLNRKLEGFEDEASKKYVASEEFEELVERTLWQAAGERSEEKRHIYSSFLAGTIKSPGEIYDEQLRFLRDLEVLQPDHIRIFKAMMEEPMRIPSTTTWDTLSQRLSDIPEVRLQDLVTQLEDMRLITGIGRTMVTSQTAWDLRNKFTPYGRRFVRYLTS